MHSVDLPDHSRWKKSLRMTWAALKRWSEADDKCQIAKPAREGEVLALEAELGYPIPPMLRDFFLRGTARLDVFWSVREKRVDELPDDLAEDVFGGLEISLEDLPSLLNNWSGWRDSLTDPEWYCGPVVPLYPFEDLFPLHETMNGDAVVFVRQGPEAGAVYFLDHEGGEMDWARLGSSIADFLEAWASVGCLGPGDLLSLFYDRDTRRLDPNRKAGQPLLARFGLG